MEPRQIIWTDYLLYRANLRGFDLKQLEEIVRFSPERYLDTENDRFVVVGRYIDQLVLIPYEENELSITPVTVHAITRQQIKFRLKTQRFVP